MLQNANVAHRNSPDSDVVAYDFDSHQLGNACRCQKMPVYAKWTLRSSPSWSDKRSLRIWRQHWSGGLEEVRLEEAYNGTPNITFSSPPTIFFLIWSWQCGTLLTNSSASLTRTTSACSNVAPLILCLILWFDQGSLQPCGAGCPTRAIDQSNVPQDVCCRASQSRQERVPWRYQFRSGISHCVQHFWTTSVS